MRELKDQLVGALLVILTLAGVIAAAINLQQQKWHLHDDGVTWLDRAGKVEAVHVVKGSPGQKAGIRVGDHLLAIKGRPVESSIEATEILAALTSWQPAEYQVEHAGQEFKTNVIIGETETDTAIYYQYAIGLGYLGIGLFVYFRRGNAPRALLFYLLCLASFVQYSFHYSGKLNTFDKVIYFGNVTAGLLAPTLFLHFCLTFPEGRSWFTRKARILLIYLPGLLIGGSYAGVWSGVVRTDVPLLEIRWLLDQAWLLFLAAMYLLGGGVLALRLRHAEDPVIRRQLTWLRNGAVFGVLPFVLIYVVPYLMGVVPTHAMKLSVLSLPLIPLTWAYAILRYRLMDVDIIFQQGYVYTLATLCVLAVFYGLLFSVGKVGDISGTTMVAVILIATFVFQPIRQWIQEHLDRHYFYKDRYDYRRTLIEFARELSSETDLEPTLQSVADRLIRTLSIQHVGFFLYDEQDNCFQLHMATERRGKPAPPLPEPLDLSFLQPNPDKPYLFFERTRHPLDVVSHDWALSVREAIAALDLTYYMPCTVRGRTIAYLGVSRTEEGDFLSTDDVELLLTLSGYVGIAVENSRLYRSLQRKVEEYERLKEFSENIVESINVGILAADLEDRVESWNTQIERLTGITREAALGRRLCDLFPQELCERFEGVRGQTGVHNIYKFVLRPDLDGVKSPTNGDSAPVPAREAILNVAIAPLVSKEYRQIGRLIIFDDITDRAELERRLVQADKLSSIGLLAAGVAHEVNTPLAVISTYAQMLAKQVSGDETKSTLLEKIARQTFRASEIVNALLNFSRTSPTDFVEVDLNKVIRETITLIDHQLQRARIEAKLSLPERLPPVKGNAGKLQQVFLNLFLNARDAMESGGMLAVRAWSEEGQVRIEIADTGAGIAPENLTRIFDPFFTTKTAKKGTGLGLSVSYGIVREHGGAIEVQSEPGAGTRFQLEFPVARKSQPARQPAIQTNQPVSLSGTDGTGQPISVSASQPE